MCEIVWPWLGERFAPLWSPYVPYSIYMQLYIPNADFFFIYVFWYMDKLTLTDRLVLRYITERP